MKQNKALFLSLLAGLFAFEAAAQQPVTVDLRLKNLKKGDSVLLRADPEGSRIDTITATRNGRAEGSITVPYTCEGVLYYLPAGKVIDDVRSSEVYRLCLNPSDKITVKGDLFQLGALQVSGGIYDDYRHRTYFDSLDKIYAEACVYSDSLFTLEKTARAMSEGPERDSLIKTIKELNNQTWAVVEKSYQLMDEYIRRYPDDPFSAYVLSGVKGSYGDKHREELFGLLGDKAKQTPAGKKMGDILAMSKAWKKNNEGIKAGVDAPDFTLTGIDGQKITLSDFRGKYVLLDFWGSWCGPCREANKFMVPLYEKYKDRENFVMISLALDRDDAAWRKAVKEDGLTWYQVNMYETPQGPGSVNVLYGISLYPSQILVSPDGKILIRQGGYNPEKDPVGLRLKSLLGE